VSSVRQQITPELCSAERQNSTNEVQIKYKWTNGEACVSA
jgi:hypothetical protein